MHTAVMTVMIAVPRRIFAAREKTGAFFGSFFAFLIMKAMSISSRQAPAAYMKTANQKYPATESKRLTGDVGQKKAVTGSKAHIVKMTDTVIFNGLLFFSPQQAVIHAVRCFSIMKHAAK